MPEALLTPAWLGATCAVPRHPCRLSHGSSRTDGRGHRAEDRFQPPTRHAPSTPRAGRKRMCAGLFMARGSRTMLPN